MQVNYNSVLLITSSEKVEEVFRKACLEKRIKLDVEHIWSDIFCYAPQEHIFVSEYFADRINNGFAEKTTLLLDVESYEKYKDRGFRFIFTPENIDEVRFNLERTGEVKVMSSSDAKLSQSQRENLFTTIVYGTTRPVYEYRDYYFDFRNDIYEYKGEPIFFTTAQKLYLSEWLLCGVHDKRRRAQLYALRRTFGADFLKDAIYGDKLLKEPRCEAVS